MTGTARTMRTQLAAGGPAAWRSVDLVTIAILGVALGVAFWGWDLLLYPAVSAALNTVFPPLASLTLGVWVLPAVVGGFVARRPERPCSARSWPPPSRRCWETSGG